MPTIPKITLHTTVIADNAPKINRPVEVANFGQKDMAAMAMDITKKSEPMIIFNFKNGVVRRRKRTLASSRPERKAKTTTSGRNADMTFRVTKNAILNVSGTNAVKMASRKSENA